ncbi:MAG: ribonuclease III [Gammaproteobacteria bacterium]|nr:ribonuclease III [Gammaproteobacteria bacterium]
MNKTLQKKLNYHFTDKKLLDIALTHRSADVHNNERLEYLGDAIVNAIIAEALYHQLPKAQEGHLSRLRATLINRDRLAELAREFELGKYVHLGQGEINAGGAERDSILSCAMEAIVGAIYLDSDYKTVQAVVMVWYEPLLNSLSHPEKHKDPKTRLQELLQAQGADLPVYEISSVSGEAHQQIFTIMCKALDKTVTAEGTSRRRAEQAAADKMLKSIQK